jgi:FKBP-type peptidyl-prolyl cis-trans isomerase FkpA
MAKLPQRIFAMTFAVLFFATASAFAIFVIIDAVQSNKNAASDKALQEVDPTDVASCQNSSEQPTLPVPKPYNVSAAVQSLQVTDITAGTGAAAKTGDCLVMKYYGTLAKDGKVFDENYTAKTGFAFLLGQGQVIEGWDKGLVGMKAGGVRRLVIPAAQAYGSSSPSEDIPANSDLVFEVKLLKIQS